MSGGLINCIIRVSVNFVRTIKLYPTITLMTGKHQTAAALAIPIADVVAATAAAAAVAAAAVT